MMILSEQLHVLPRGGGGGGGGNGCEALPYYPKPILGKDLTGQCLTNSTWLEEKKRE